MAEFGLSPAPTQDPVGGFIQGATQGIGLVDVLRKRHRDIQLENQQDTLAIVKLIQELGVDRARAVAQKAGLEGDPSLFAGGPARGAEERGLLTAAQARAAGQEEGLAGTTSANLLGLGSILRGVAAKSSAKSAWEALMSGDTKAMQATADKETENATNLQLRAMTAVFGTPEEKAAAVSQSQESRKLAERYRNLALLMAQRGGALTLKEMQSQGFLIQPSTAAAKGTDKYSVIVDTAPH